jgi:hypothetical protein
VGNGGNSGKVWISVFQGFVGSGERNKGERRKIFYFLDFLGDLGERARNKMR